MGFGKKIEGLIVESEAKKRIVLAEIPLCTPLKSIVTKQEFEKRDVEEGEEEESSRSTTPTSKESRNSSRIQCPPAPRKPKSKPRCYFGGGRAFFTIPADLESLFICRAEKA